MIKDLDTQYTKINVHLKNGTSFLNKDIAQQPFGEHDKFVSFWHKESFVIYNFDSIDFIEFIKDV